MIISSFNSLVLFFPTIKLVLNKQFTTVVTMEVQHKRKNVRMQKKNKMIRSDRVASSELILFVTENHKGRYRQFFSLKVSRRRRFWSQRSRAGRISVCGCNRLWSRRQILHLHCFSLDKITSRRSPFLSSTKSNRNLKKTLTKVMYTGQKAFRGRRMNSFY